jgi:hypothetical protein
MRESDQAFVCLTYILRCFFRLLSVFYHLAGVLIERLPLSAERDVSPLSLEKRKIKFPFQLLQRLCKARLRDHEFPRGFS